jgi:hypothetical protein
MENGATVLHATLDTDANQTTGYVLANYRDQYVTWFVGRNQWVNEPFAAYSGNYFNKYSDALANYKERRAVILDN